MTILHMDDFLVTGTSEFLQMLSQKLKRRFTFGKTELAKFKFTGLNIEQTEEGIFVDQIEFIHSIQPISSKKMDVHESEVLNKSELKAYRALTGQFNWRPRAPGLI